MSEATPPPAGRFVEAEGVRLHYVERGAGPPVVLLHGNGATWQDFDASGVLDVLAARHRTIAFDRPGSGDSARPSGRRWTAAAQARALMQAAHRLGAARPVVVGHSWGALAALHAGIADPGGVAGLVLLAGYFTPTRRADVAVLSIPGVPVIGRLISYTVLPALARRFSGRAVERIFAPNPVPERFRARFPVARALRASQLHAVAQDTGFLNRSAAEAQRRLGEVRMPVAILAGTADAIVDTERHSGALHRNIPGSTLRLFEGTGHMLHYFEQDAVAATVAEMAASSMLLDR